MTFDSENLLKLLNLCKEFNGTVSLISKPKIHALKTLLFINQRQRKAKIQSLQ